jgi:selenocysteine-specific elongation factor
VKVRGVQVHGRPATAAAAGQRAAINLSGVDAGDVLRGETLLTPGTLSVTRRVDAEIDLLRSARPLKHGARVRVHNGTAEVLGRVSIAGPSTAAKAAGDQPADEIASGGAALVRLRLETPAVLTRGDRFIIRAYSPPITIGGGIVLDADPTRPGVRSAEGRRSLEQLRIGRGEIAALVAMIESGGLSGVAKASLASRAGVAPVRIPSILKALAAHAVAAVGDRLIASAHLERAADDLLALVRAFHKANPMSEGLPREEAREKIFARVAPAVFEQVVDDLKAARALAGSERLALPTHKAAVAGADDQVRAAIVDAYRDGGLKPPDTAAIEAAVGAPRAIVEKVTALLLREKVLLRLDTLVFHGDALRNLKTDVIAMKASAPGGRATVDVAAFKDRYGISRKFAIPLLEYLDRERVTRRTGDVRLVL